MKNPSHFPRPALKTLVTVMLSGLLLSLAPATCLAGSATWKASPLSGLWNSVDNWSPATIPNDVADTATFAQSSQTSISFSDPITVGAIIFNSGANTYDFTVGPSITLDLTGAGLTNNALVTQNFTAATDTLGNFGTISFSENATVGVRNAFTTRSGMFNDAPGGFLQFTNQASAGSGIFDNEGAFEAGANGGETDFFENAQAGASTLNAHAGVNFSTAGGTVAFFGNSTAATATIIADGGAIAGAFGGSIYFRGNSSAAQSHITAIGGSTWTSTGSNLYFEETASAGSAFIGVNGGQGSGAINGATLSFLGSSTAGSASIFLYNGSADDAQVGRLFFYEDSSGGTARVELFGGEVDFSLHNPGTITVGSVEFDGAVYLGSINLEIGGNNFADLFQGSMRDGGAGGGSGASLTKVGNNALVLTSPNYYTGGTTINSGSINLQARKGSATGPGPVQVNAGGTLSGFGTVAGPVTIGPDGALSPGNLGTGRLTTKRLLTFDSGSNYIWECNVFHRAADVVGGQEVTISGDAKFRPSRQGGGKFPIGQVIVVVENDGPDPINGTFSNLPDGSITRIGGNNFQANYEGRDGNDLTLTVVP